MLLKLLRKMSVALLLETLKTTQSDIIETIEQTLQIQQNGRQKRKEAEKELVGLEDELKQQHLLDEEGITKIVKSPGHKVLDK